jgi:hypothetical protein
MFIMGWKSIVLFLVCCTILISTISADDSTFVGWKKSLVTDVTVTQTSYSDSWTGGEYGSVNWVSNLNGWAERQLSEKFNFKSTLKLSFGQTLSQDEDSLGEKYWKKPKKSTDLIDWENVGRFTAGWFADPYVAFRLESQFYDGSVEGYRRWLSPLKLTESAGLSRKIYEKDKDFVTTRLGFALREIFTKNLDMSTTPYTTETESTTDGGFESVTDVELNLKENLKYTSKLSLYKAVFFSEKDAVAGTPREDYWKAVDVNWENIVSASITKIITVNLYTQLLYDKEISLKGRWKETLALGFVFKMI